MVIFLGLLLVSLWIVEKRINARPQAAGDIFNAEISRACAPWDGPAFSVSIPTLAGAQEIKPPLIHVSIWHAPNWKGRRRFVFPDQTGKNGGVFLRPRVGSMQELQGHVAFKSVKVDEVVEGEFDLQSPTGNRFRGKFRAKWTGQIQRCG